MTTQLYDKWIEALDSYNQGYGTLRSSNGENYCCLGVLCDISDLGDWTTVTDDNDGFEYLVNQDYSSSQLPNKIRAQVGLANEAGKFNFYELSPQLRIDILTAMPNRGHSLNQIFPSRNRHIFFTALTYINDIVDKNFQLVKRILEERPPSLFE